MLSQSSKHLYGRNVEPDPLTTSVFNLSLSNLVEFPKFGCQINFDFKITLFPMQ